MKKNIVYIIAGLVAVASAVVLFTMFRTQTAETPEPIVVEDIQPVEMTQIIVASKKILSGSQITNDMLKTKQIPKEEKTQSMIVLSTDAEGATANRTIEADQPILTTMLDQPQSYIAGTNGLSYVIPDGMVAVAVNATDLEGVAGYLNRGDVVNILADAKAIKAAMEGIEYYQEDIDPVNLAYLAKNVTILAVGDKQYDAYMASQEQVAGRNENAMNTDEDSSEEGEKNPYTYDCVILCLDDFSAQLVVEVLQTSKLTFTLKHREFGNHDVTTPELATVPQSFIYVRPDLRAG